MRAAVTCRTGPPRLRDRFHPIQTVPVCRTWLRFALAIATHPNRADLAAPGSAALAIANSIQTVPTAAPGSAALAVATFASPLASTTATGSTGRRHVGMSLSAVSGS